MKRSSTNRMAGSLRIAAALVFALPPLAASAASDFIYGSGFDVDLTTAFFVSTAGSDSNAGSTTAPFATIAKGIEAANADATRKNVVVASGIYDESITLADGVSVYGHFHAGSWARDAGSYSIVDGVSVAGIHERTVVAANVTAPTTFDGFVIVAAANAHPGGNSYGIYVTGSSANLQITNNIVFGGHGGPGTAGTAGADGTQGADGAGRNPNLLTPDLAYDAEDAAGSGECNLSNFRQYPNGGALTCGGVPVNGGAGGGNQCPVMSFCDTDSGLYGCQNGTQYFHWHEYTAIDGAAGTGSGAMLDGGGGGGGYGGDDGIQVHSSYYNTYACYPPDDTDGDGAYTYGLPGARGANGGNASGGAGCSAAAGMVAANNWVGGFASGGGSGGNGGGGGGGGAGGGGKCQGIPGYTACTDGNGKDTLGGHGGGGGSGGCGGAGGGAGGAGGGAFGIFIVGGGSAPVVTGNTLFGGTGGGGGNGGNGGKGGLGGLGGLGGTTGVPVIYCTDVAGRGGDGGTGGYAGGGGGGCGGASIGIYSSGVGTPNYCSGAAGNTIGAGVPGAGGAGGLSYTSSGSAGAGGVAAACSLN